MGGIHVWSIIDEEELPKEKSAILEIIHCIKHPVFLRIPCPLGILLIHLSLYQKQDDHFWKFYFLDPCNISTGLSVL